MDKLSKNEREAHIANILDPVSRTLDPRLFLHPEAARPALKPEIASWLQHTIFEVLERHGYDNPQGWLTLVLTGSITTYQYSDASDIDVSLFVDTKRFPDWSRAEMVAICTTELDGIKAPGTPFPLQAYVVPPGITPADLYKPGLRSGYVVYGKNAGKWIVPPERSRVHNVEQEMHDQYTIALLSADKMDFLLRFEPDIAMDYWHDIHAKRRADEAAGLGDYTQSNITYKMLVSKFPQLESQ